MFLHKHRPLPCAHVTAGSCVSTSQATILAGGSARVTFPRLTKKGSYTFRVVVGAAFKPLVVNVR